MIFLPESSLLPFNKLPDVTDGFWTLILHENENSIKQMEEHFIELINEECSVRRPLDSKELLQQ